MSAWAQVVRAHLPPPRPRGLGYMRRPVFWLTASGRGLSALGLGWLTVAGQRRACTGLPRSLRETEPSIPVRRTAVTAHVHVISLRVDRLGSVTMLSASQT
jgi:hypothetical protein